MAYTTINKHTDYFNTKLYTGNGSTNAITGVGFQPALAWLKARSYNDDHFWFDAVRGVTKYIRSSSDGAEVTNANSLTTFGSDGFTLGSDGGANSNTSTYASWNWKIDGSSSSNTDGDITSTVLANQTAGFSIVQWTGNGTAGATVGHGLGSEMKFMILKDYGLARSWLTYHTSLGNGSGINFNESGQAGTSSAYWNNTSPTSSVFSTSTYSNENNSNYICYCFSEVPGYSKFGSYTGNGSADGTFIYTGFKPVFLILKRTDAVGPNWVLSDAVRDVDNPVLKYFHPNSNALEQSGSRDIDLLSNGFKIRNSNSTWNISGGNYIYMAFGQSLVGSNNVPCTAR